MWERGSYWELKKRPAEEMEENWNTFLPSFSAFDQDFFGQDEVFFFILSFSVLIIHHSYFNGRSKKWQN